MVGGQSKIPDQRDQFHKWVGFCVTEWAQIDGQLFGIFHQCVGPLKQCAIIYYRTPGLDARLGLTDEIVRSVLPKPIRKSGDHPNPFVKRWDSLRNEILSLLSTRRRIAHQPVMIQRNWLKRLTLNAAAFNEMPLNSVGTSAEWYAIYANEFERLRTKEADHPALTVEDLITHFEAINHLVPKLYQFYLDLVSKLYAEPPPQDPAPGLETSKDREGGGPK